MKYKNKTVHTKRYTIKLKNGEFIPNATNKFIFELRESCRQIDDRKWHSINSIQCHLRSSIFGALTRSNMNLFVAFGINKKAMDAGAKAHP
jgi:hypothetical protein